MKNINLIINAVLGIAVIVLFVLFFNLKNNTTSTIAETESVLLTDSTLSTVKNETVDSILNSAKTLEFPIAYVNIDTIGEKFVYFVNKKRALEKSIELKYSDLSNKEVKLNQEYETFARKVQDGTTKLVTTEQLENAKYGFEKRAQDLMKDKQEFEQNVMENEQKLVNEVNTSLDNFLKKYKKELKYSYVFQKGGATGGSLLYANESLDITNEVLKALNAEYASKTKK